MSTVFALALVCEEDDHQQTRILGLVMEPKYVSAEQLAALLTDMAQSVSREEFARVLEDILGDTDTGDVAQIAWHMPPELLRLIPRRYLH